MQIAKQQKPLWTNADFLEVFQRIDFSAVAHSIQAKTQADVERALAKSSRDLEDFKALLSPAAAPYLEPMAQLAQAVTRQRFGNCVSLYIPLYLSNECHNACVYCGFRQENKIPRKTLSQAEVLAEIQVIKQWGYEHVLLVTGDMSRKRGLAYLSQALDWVRPHFAQVSLEVQPMETEDYAALMQKGLNGVMLYQETYSPSYPLFHLAGSKKDMTYRLQGPDRLGRAGIHRIGLGVLLGLADWRADSWMLALHLAHLKRHYWQTKYSVSFPRLRPATGALEPPHPVSDRELAQLICAYRLLDENLDLSLSTRESPTFRDGVARLGVTNMSAGSKTEPGGYAQGGQELEQFAVHDDRAPQAVAQALAGLGLEAVFKDWEPYYNG